MAVPSPLPISTEPTAAADQPSVIACRNEWGVGTGNEVADVECWFSQPQLQNQYGRLGAGLGLSVYIVPQPAVPLPGGWGPASLAALVFEVCTVQIKIGGSVIQQLAGSLFQDTKYMQRILEIPIRLPYPTNNDGLRFRAFTAPLPSEAGSSYFVNFIFKLLLPPNNTEPSQVLRPRGLGMITSL